MLRIICRAEHPFESFLIATSTGPDGGQDVSGLIPIFFFYEALPEVAGSPNVIGVALTVITEDPFCLSLAFAHARYLNC